MTLVVSLLLGCGSGSSTEGSSEPTKAAEPAQRESGGSSAASSGGAGNPGHQAKAVPRYEGAEEEVEQAGKEASGSEREAVVAVEQEYLTALSEDDFPVVCELLSTTTRSQLQQLVQGRKVDCAAILGRLLAGPAASTAHRDLEGELRRVRLSGDRAFVIFHAPGARLYLISLVREGGRWRVATLTATVLAPAKAAVEG